MLDPGARAAVATGLRLEIPAGYVGLIWPRSGLAVRHGIDTLAGVIDSDYRGEVLVVLVNHGAEPVRIAAGDRIAQVLVQNVERARLSRPMRWTPPAGAGGLRVHGRLGRGDRAPGHPGRLRAFTPAVLWRGAGC